MTDPYVHVHAALTRFIAQDLLDLANSSNPDLVKASFTERMRGWLVILTDPNPEDPKVPKPEDPKVPKPEAPKTKVPKPEAPKVPKPEAPKVPKTKAPKPEAPKPTLHLEIEGANPILPREIRQDLSKDTRRSTKLFKEKGWLKLIGFAKYPERGGNRGPVYDKDVYLKHRDDILAYIRGRYKTAPSKSRKAPKLDAFASPTGAPLVSPKETER